MPFCNNCGYEYRDGMKFCLRCGNSFSSINNNEKRRTTYAGEVKKCPNCGEIITDSFSVTCKACGYDFKNVNISNAINEFKRGLDQIENNKSTDNVNTIRLKKANYIKSYPIPNSKADIIEFATIAYSNLSSLNNNGDVFIINAWKSLFISAYEKAKISFRNDTDFSKIEAMHNSLTLNEKKRRIRIGIIIAAIACGITVLFAVSYRNRIRSKEELEAKKAGVEQAIDDSDYDKALSLTEELIEEDKLSEEDKEKWVQKRKEILWIMDKRQDGDTSEHPEAKTISISMSAKDFKDKNYKDVEKLLEKEGFFFIETNELKDIKIGLLAKEEEVESVSIDGNTDFEEGDEFQDDASVVINYHSKK